MDADASTLSSGPPILEAGVKALIVLVMLIPSVPEAPTPIPDWFAGGADAAMSGGGGGAEHWPGVDEPGMGGFCEVPSNPLRLSSGVGRHGMLVSAPGGVNGEGSDGGVLRVGGVVDCCKDWD